MMNARNIRTILRWMSRNDPPIVTSEFAFFAAAYYWRHRKHNEWRVTQCYLAYTKYGQIPDFIRDFVKRNIYTVLSVSKIKLIGD